MLAANSRWIQSSKWQVVRLLRFYLRTSAIRKGKKFIGRRLLKPLLPPPPESFVMSLANGSKLKVQYREEIGLLLGVGLGFEEAETDILCQYARPASHAVDVGANIGLFAVALARAVGPTGRVLAIEPLASNVERLIENAALNQLTNIDFIRAAAGDAEGQITLNLASDPAYGSTTQVVDKRATGGMTSVRSTQVDSVWQMHGRPPVSAMKIDVEGGEEAVLHGATQLIKTCRPALLVEANSPARLQVLVDWLGQQDYRYFQPPRFQAHNFLFLTPELPAPRSSSAAGARRGS
jgi:FkbM family methyltransferase